MPSSDSSAVHIVLTIRFIIAMGKSDVYSSFCISMDLIEPGCVLVNTQYFGMDLISPSVWMKGALPSMMDYP
jgi:hypothetical protein